MQQKFSVSLYLRVYHNVDKNTTLYCFVYLCSRKISKPENLCLRRFYTIEKIICKPRQKKRRCVYFDHPYWTQYTADMSGPRFDDDFPDVKDYMNRYNENVVVMDQLAHALMNIAFPGASDQVAGAPWN